MQIITVKCGLCTKDFGIKHGEYNSRLNQSKSGKLFCSKICMGKFANPMPHSKTTTCVYCQRLFVVPGKLVGRMFKPGKLHFCSHKCSSSYHTTKAHHAKQRVEWLAVLG